MNGLKPLHTIAAGGVNYTIYIGLIAVVLNVVVAVFANVVLPRTRPLEAIGARP